MYANINDIKNLIRGLVSAKGLGIVALIYCVLIIMMSCTKNGNMRFSEQLDEAERLVWQHPDSSIAVLEGMQYTEMGKEDAVRRQMLLELGTVRQQQYTQLYENNNHTDSVMLKVVAFYRATDDKKNLCKALYTLAIIQYTENHDLISATRNLKEAADYIQYLEQDSPYAGMIYLCLAFTASDEQLHSVMQAYALQAIPYFKQTNDHLHLCACYRDVAYAGLYGDGERDVITQYFDSALSEANLAHDEVMMYDILFHKEQYEDCPDTANLLFFSKQLCDTFGIRLHAGNIAGIYIQQGNTAEAEKYLHILSADTSSSAWCKEQYLYQHSRLLLLQGKKDSAFHELERMYGIRVEQLNAESRSRAYTISKLYDLEREQSNVLRLQITARRLRGIVAGSIAVILIGILISLLVYTRIKEKNERIALYAKIQHEIDEREKINLNAKCQLEKQEKSHLKRINKLLATELEDKRKTLRQYLHNRLAMTNALGKYMDEHGSDIPPTIVKELRKLLVLSESDWEQFSEDYNKASNNFLVRKQKEHPDLTERDLRYIALYSLGFDNIDICSLFYIGKAAGWNIKSAILRRLSKEDKEIEAIMSTKPVRSEYWQRGNKKGNEPQPDTE